MQKPFPDLHVTVVVESTPGSGHDRHAVCRQPSSLVVALADGSGGSSGAAQAADLLVEALGSLGDPGGSAGDPTWWFEWLHAMDTRLYATPDAGETTGLVASIVAVDPPGTFRVVGAAIGDSRALLLGEGGVLDLTRHAEPRPRMGSGRAVPSAFQADLGDGILLLATDGLFAAMETAEIAAALHSLPPEGAIRMVLRMLTMRHGTLPDDVTAIVVQGGSSGSL